MTNRFPRKLKKSLPIGLYCYTGKRFDMSTGVYHIKPCRFLTKSKSKNDTIMSWCRAIKNDILDQCKGCGEKYYESGQRSYRKRRPRKLFTKKLEYVW